MSWEIGSLVWLVLEIGGLATAVHALRRVQHESLLGWIIALLSIPVFSLPIYWLGGRTRFNSYRETYRKAQESEPYLTELERCEEVLNAHRGEPSGRISKLLHGLDDGGWLENNQIKLLIDGPPSYQAMLDSIATARKYVLMETYIFADDETGRSFMAQLAAAAGRGVEVDLLVDRVGSRRFLRSAADELRKAGVRVHAFTAHRGLFWRFELNFRDHRKILVIDGAAGFVGGVNVSDNYVSKGEFKMWRDAHARIEGPAVLALQRSFLRHLSWVDPDRLPPLEWEARPVADGKPIAVATTGPADQPSPHAPLLLTAVIHEARERLWISTPFLVPDRTVDEALRAAAARGVDVRLLVPHRSDSRLADLAMLSLLPEMDECGIRVYRHRKAMVHLKTWVIDDQLAAIGSMNLDNRSLRLNFEVMALVRDEAFTGEIATMLEQDFDHSEILGASTYTDRSRWQQITAGVARLFSPLL